MGYSPLTVFTLTVSAAALVLFLQWLGFLKKTLVIRRSWKSLPGAPRSFSTGNLRNLAPLLDSDKHPGKPPKILDNLSLLRIPTYSSSYSNRVRRWRLTAETSADYGLYAIWKSLGRPKWFLVDFWPRQLPLVCIADPAIAEQLTRTTASQPESTPKMETPRSLKILLGATSVSTAQVSTADDWGIKHR